MKKSNKFKKKFIPVTVKDGEGLATNSWQSRTNKNKIDPAHHSDDFDRLNPDAFDIFEGIELEESSDNLEG